MHAILTGRVICEQYIHIMVYFYNFTHEYMNYVLVRFRIDINKVAKDLGSKNIIFQFCLIYIPTGKKI